MTAVDLAELRRLAEAATPGPWFWAGYKNRSAGMGPYLATTMPGHGWVTVMDCSRLGMRSAQPRFRVDHRMVDSVDLAVREVDYRNDIARIDHPDAAFIAAANPATILALLDRIEAVRALHSETMPWPPSGSGSVTTVCKACLHYVPCPTARALDGEVGAVSACTCTPCTTPAYGVPGHAHCAACCYGSLIAEYDHECPISEHSGLARAQFGEAQP